MNALVGVKVLTKEVVRVILRASYTSVLHLWKTLKMYMSVLFVYMYVNKNFINKNRKTINPLYVCHISLWHQVLSKFGD